MSDNYEQLEMGRYNPIEFVELTTLSKEGIKKEALKVLAAEFSALKLANFVRRVSNASVSLEPEMKAVVGSIAFVAKDAGNLLADVLMLGAKALGAVSQDSPSKGHPKQQPGA